jgi:hypothetical protein
VAAVTVALLAVLARHGVDGSATHPWHFPTPDEYSDRLTRHGFAVRSIALIPRPTFLPTGMAAWLDTFGNPFFLRIAPQDRAAARDEAVELLRHALQDRDGQWTADYVRLRFAAVMQLEGEN